MAKYVRQACKGNSSGKCGIIDATGLSKELTVEYQYIVVQYEYIQDDEKKRGFGISVIRKQGEKAELLMSSKMLVAQRDELDALVESCNSLGLDPIHFSDVIDDFLTEPKQEVLLSVV